MIEVTVRDTETGETETSEVQTYVIVCAEPYFLSHRQEYPTKGTTVLTVKRDDAPIPEGDEPAKETE